MAETKYGKYFFSGFVPPPGGKRAPGEHHVGLAALDDEIMKGSHFIRITVIPPEDTPPPDSPGHPPHIHKYPELLIHLGMNPDDPFDLGAEVEMCMGKEMEKHVFNKSTVVYIPANFIHAPWTFRKVVRPWIFIQINQGPLHTQKYYMQILPKEIRDKMPLDEEEWH